MSRAADDPDVWVLCFRPAPGDYPPMARRVARLLKIAKRSCGMICTRHCGEGAAGLPRSISLEPDEVLPPAIAGKDLK